MRARRQLGTLAPIPIRPQRIGAWVTFDHTPTVRGSLNVSAVTDDGVGAYTVTWARAFSATTYALGGLNRTNVTDARGGIGILSGTLPTMTSVQLVTTAQGSATLDAHEVCLVAMEPL